MKKLRLTFLNEDGTKKNITLQHVAQDLSPEAVYAAMVRLTELEIFEKNGVKLMTKVLRACYVEKVVTEIFAVSTNNAGEEILVVNPRYSCDNEKQSRSFIARFTDPLLRKARPIQTLLKPVHRVIKRGLAVFKVKLNPQLSVPRANREVFLC